ncbi:MAG: SoxR reducing system RseC family protein [Bacteroidales bacterium]|nr:SoxR reducing system RseC family protein [Bacteroidales bacterium]
MIEHEGIIEKINGNRITVRILQQSACSACHAKSVCMAADSKEKLVDIPDITGQYHVNERVIIEGKESIGYKAVLWAFVIPLLILLGALVASLTLWDFTEIEAALAAIVALVPYYLVLYLLRNKMAKSFRFNIKNTN